MPIKPVCIKYKDMPDISFKKQQKITDLILICTRKNAPYFKIKTTLDGIMFYVEEEYKMRAEGTD